MNRVLVIVGIAAIVLLMVTNVAVLADLTRILTDILNSIKAL